MANGKEQRGREREKGRASALFLSVNGRVKWKRSSFFRKKAQKSKEKKQKEKEAVRLLLPVELHLSCTRSRFVSVDARSPCRNPAQQQRERRSKKTNQKLDAPLARRPRTNRAPPYAPRGGSRGRLLRDESPRLLPRGERVGGVRKEEERESRKRREREGKTTKEKRVFSTQRESSRENAGPSRRWSGTGPRWAD